MTDADALRRYTTAADADAFAELVHRYEQLVFSVCVRRLGCSADADDAAQQTFMKLARAATGIKGSVAAWLHTTATRTAIDLGRQKTTRRKHEAQAAQHRHDYATHREPAIDADAIAASGFDPALHASWNEVSHHLDEAVLELPAMHRRLIIEVYFQGRTQREVAEELGKSQARVCRQLQEAVASLRSLLSKRGVMLPVGALASGLMFVQQSSAAPTTALTTEFMKVGITAYGVPSAAASSSVLTGAAGSTAGASVWTHPLVVALGTLAAAGLIAAVVAMFSGNPSSGPSVAPPPPVADAPHAP